MTSCYNILSLKMKASKIIIYIYFFLSSIKSCQRNELQKKLRIQYNLMLLEMSKYLFKDSYEIEIRMVICQEYESWRIKGSI